MLVRWFLGAVFLGNSGLANGRGWLLDGGWFGGCTTKLALCKKFLEENLGGVRMGAL